MEAVRFIVPEALSLAIARLFLHHCARIYPGWPNHGSRAACGSFTIKVWLLEPLQALPSPPTKWGWGGELGTSAFQQVMG